MTHCYDVYIFPAAEFELDLIGESNRQLTEKDQLVLECIATNGFSQPFFTWLLNGVPLFSSDRVQINTVTNQENDGLFTVNSTLTILSTLPSDSGVYTCRANLEASSLARSTNVTIQGLLIVME